MESPRSESLLDRRRRPEPPRRQSDEGNGAVRAARSVRAKRLARRGVPRTILGMNWWKAMEVPTGEPTRPQSGAFPDRDELTNRTGTLPGESSAVIWLAEEASDAPCAAVQALESWDMEEPCWVIVEPGPGGVPEIRTGSAAVCGDLHE